jgi:hypothetical protein
MSSERPSVSGIASVRPVASWASVFLDYLDLKAHLLAVESKEAVSDLTGFLVIVRTLLVMECLDLRSHHDLRGGTGFLSSQVETSKAGFSDDLERSCEG